MSLLDHLLAPDGRRWREKKSLVLVLCLQTLESEGVTHSQNQYRPKLQNTSPNFGYMVQKCKTKL